VGRRSEKKAPRKNWCWLSVKTKGCRAVSAVPWSYSNACVCIIYVHYTLQNIIIAGGFGTTHNIYIYIITLYRYLSYIQLYITPYIGAVNIYYSTRTYVHIAGFPGQWWKRGSSDFCFRFRVETIREESFQSLAAI